MARIAVEPDGRFAEGPLAGGRIGATMEVADHSCIGWTLGRVPSRATVSWDVDDRRYAVTPTRTYEAPNGDRCRDYVTQATISGQLQQNEATACRGRDGFWRMRYENGIAVITRIPRIGALPSRSAASD